MRSGIAACAYSALRPALGPCSATQRPQRKMQRHPATQHAAMPGTVATYARACLWARRWAQRHRRWQGGGKAGLRPVPAERRADLA